MTLAVLHQSLGDPIADPEEGTKPIPVFLRVSNYGSLQTDRAETFVLFSQQIPSQNLGFVDAKAKTLEISVNGQDFTIQQSPGVLSSNRAGGTTGAGINGLSSRPQPKAETSTKYCGRLRP